MSGHVGQAAVAASCHLPTTITTRCSRPLRVLRRSGSVCLDVINQTWSPMFGKKNGQHTWGSRAPRDPNPLLLPPNLNRRPRRFCSSPPAFLPAPLTSPMLPVRNARFSFTSLTSLILFAHIVRRIAVGLHGASSAIYRWVCHSFGVLNRGAPLFVCHLHGQRWRGPVDHSPLTLHYMI